MMLENNIEKISENNLLIEQHKKYFTAQARRAHVCAYQSSGESMIAYCDKCHLALSTFKSWVTKYGEKKMPASFVPVTLSAKNPKTKSLLCCEIHTAGIKIILPEGSDIETLIQFIRGLSHANPVKSTGNIVL